MQDLSAFAETRSQAQLYLQCQGVMQQLSSKIFM